MNLDPLVECMMTKEKGPSPLASLAAEAGECPDFLAYGVEAFARGNKTPDFPSAAERLGLSEYGLARLALCRRPRGEGDVVRVAEGLGVPRSTVRWVEAWAAHREGGGE